MTNPPKTSRIVIVTGAGIGIGQATARAFASAGDHVVVTDILEHESTATVEAIRAAGGSAEFAYYDVRSTSATVTFSITWSSPRMMRALMTLPSAEPPTPPVAEVGAACDARSAKPLATTRTHRQAGRGSSAWARARFNTSCRPKSS